MITSSSNGMVTINFHNFNHRTHQQSSLKCRHDHGDDDNVNQFIILYFKHKSSL